MGTLRDGQQWDNDELLIVAGLYGELGAAPSKQKPLVIYLAMKLSRSPAAITKRCANFGHLDLNERNKGCVHLSGGEGKDTCAAVWRLMESAPPIFEKMLANALRKYEMPANLHLQFK